MPELLPSVQYEKRGRCSLLVLSYNNDRFTQKKLENGIKWTEGWADFEALNTYHLSDEDSEG